MSPAALEPRGKTRPDAKLTGVVGNIVPLTSRNDAQCLAIFCLEILVGEIIME